MQQGRALYRRSTFFVDVINVVLHIDLFIYHDLSIRIKDDPCLQYFFGKKLPNSRDGESIQQLDVRLVREFSNKLHQNILEDWIDKDEFIKMNGEASYGEYLQTLYHMILSEPTYDDYMQTTAFGSTLKILTKDDRVDKIIFYIPFESQPICDNIVEAFSGYSSNKMEIMVGGKKAGEKLPLADSYIFENVSDIDAYLRIPHKDLTEVIVPAYEYNMSDDRSDEEKEVEQITIKKLNLQEIGNDYQTKYNLSINSIRVPI